MSKGGTTTSTSSIDPQIKEAFLANFQQAQGVAGALPTQQFAGYNPLYQAGEEALVNTALAGPGIAGTDLAAQMAAYGGVYQPGQIKAEQTNLGLGLVDKSGLYSGAGTIGSYMNPFTEQVRTNALADLESARRAAIQQTGERATAARAFGGSRQGVAESLTNAGFAKQAANLGATLNEQAFNQAVALQQADIGRRSAADIANQQAGLQGAQLRLGGASQLGNLAAQQQALRLGGAQAVMGAGGQRQALEQQQMDAIRNIGLQRLGIVQSSLGAQPANLGMQATTPYSQNVGAGLLGGALAGSQLAGVAGLTAGTGAGLGALAALI
jgi:hypothetical protein